jgi:hypothetical protein
MSYQKTTIATQKAKDAALYCTHVVPVALIWENHETLTMDIPALLSSLLPPYLRSDAEFVRQLTDCIDFTSENVLDNKIHELNALDPMLAKQKMSELLKVKISPLGFRIGKMVSDNENAYAFFGKGIHADDEAGQDFLVTSLSGLELIDTSRLSWETILAIRSDPNASSKLRRLRLLFENNYCGKSRAYIEDDIIRRLDEYRLTVKEYHLETTALVLEQFLLSKSLLALGTSSVVACLAGAPIVACASLIAGASIEVGKAFLRVAKQRCKLDQQVQNLAIGYIVDVQRSIAPTNDCRTNEINGDNGSI